MSLNGMQNDLDLDLFCQEVVHNDIYHLKRTPGWNAYLHQCEGTAHRSIVETSMKGARTGTQPEVFGTL